MHCWRRFLALLVFLGVPALGLAQAAGSAAAPATQAQINALQTAVNNAQSAGAAGALNYYFVRSWGRRAQKYFVERHRALRDAPLELGRPQLVPPTAPITHYS